MGWLACFAMLCALYITTESARLPEGMGTCLHEPGKITAKVHQGGSTVGAREKRQSTYEPIRIYFHYHATVDTMLNPTQRRRLQDVAIPAIKSILESSVSVIRATSPILLDRECDEQSFYMPVEDPRQCIGQCAETPMCLLVPIPENHLKRCVECNNGSVSNCTTRPGSVDGPGVPDTDLIIYVSAFDCPFGFLAFASSCQLESELDRPISGIINFCPGSYDNLNDDLLTRIGLHEVMHALVFSPTLYPWFRDENGNPRTERDEFGFPPDEAGNTTIQTETYTDWSTRNGLVEHDVSFLVTPNVIEQARIHFDCPDIRGVELENQGGGGTASAHWEQRVLGDSKLSKECHYLDKLFQNEGMTGSLLFGVPFSRITFGLMEDSGWYAPNYEMAEALAWGLNTGCTIPHGSCREHINQQQASGMNISPYCDEVDDNTLGCTVDHEFFSTCTLSSQANPPFEFQFFDANEAWGGQIQTTDYCPFENAMLSMRCSEASNNPPVNYGGQLYGAGSRCFQLGRDWTKNDINGINGVYSPDAGCYMYNCTSSGVEIILEGMSILCSCEGEEIVVDVNIGNVRYQGSYICPSCASVCYDDLASCPSTEPAPCPGQVTNYTAGVPHPCQSNPCDVNEVCTGFGEDGFTCESAGSCLAASYNECCNSTSGNCTGSPPNCFCDSMCRSRGDCCSDIGDTCPIPFRSCSVAGYDTCCTGSGCVGQPPIGPIRCYCDTSCRSFGDCCDDIDITCPLECGELADPTNGQVNTSSGATVGSTATYNCSTGFTLNGNSSRTCGSDGEWSGSPPTCEAPDPCQSNPCDVNAVCIRSSVLNSIFFCVCNSGYFGNGFMCEPPNPCQSNPCDFNAVCTRDDVLNSNFTCACNSGFMGDGFNCEMPDPCQSSPCDINATCTRNSVSNSDFTCACNSELVGDGFTCESAGTCLAASYNECCNISASGNCTGSPPNCYCDSQCRSRGDCCSDIGDTCPLPPSSCRAAGHDTCCRNSVVVDCAGQSNGPGRCYCDTSCRSFGDCCDDIDITCPLECGELADPTNGQVTTSGSTATYNCSTGFTLNGNSSRTCGDGEWSGSPPTCEAPDPCQSNPCDVNAVCIRSSVLNSIFFCLCNSGYVGNGFMCEPPNPCHSNPCDFNAVCTIIDDVLNSNFTCACNSGFMGDGFNCEMPDPCQSSPCDVNATCTRNSVSNSDFTCACNSELVGDGFTCESAGTCLAASYNECCNISASGNCTGSPPNCFCDPLCRSRGDCCSDIGDTCPLPPSSCRAAGHDTCCRIFDCAGQSNGPATCYCDTLCRMLGDCCDDIDITCPLNCMELANPTNGQVATSNGTTLGSTATYNCSTGYILNGNSSRTCDSDGIWSGSRPTCEEPLLELSCSLSSDGLSVECSSLLDGVVSLIYNCSLNNRPSSVCGPGPIFSLPMDGLGPGSYTYNITAFSPDGQRSSSVITFAVIASGSGSGEVCQCKRSVECSIEGKLTGQSEADVTGMELKCTIMFSNGRIDTGSGSNLMIDESFSTEYLSPGSLSFLGNLGVVKRNFTDCAVPNGIPIAIQSIRQLSYIKDNGSFGSRSNVPMDRNQLSVGLGDDNQCALDTLLQWLSTQPSPLPTAECRQGMDGKRTDIFFIVECPNMGV